MTPQAITEREERNSKKLGKKLRVIKVPRSKQ